MHVRRPEATRQWSLDAAKEALDEVVATIPMPTINHGCLGFASENAWLRARRVDGLVQGARVVAAVGHRAGGLLVFEQTLGVADVGLLTR